MKRTIALLSLLLSACSANHSIVPAFGDRPAIVTVSAYTRPGCLEKLRTEAISHKWEIKELSNPEDVAGLLMEAVFFPAVKGVSCSAQIVKGEIPSDF